MEMIKAGIKNEITKLFNLKKYKVLLILIGILSFFSNILGAITQGSIIMSFINSPFIILTILTQFILPLIIAMAAADLFTAEQENGSIKAIIMRPISRIEIFMSKVFGIILYIILSLFICLIISLISSIAFNGIESVNIIETLIAYVVSIIPMIPIVFFAVAISQMCKNSSSTVMMFVLGYIIIIAASIIIPRINPMVFTSYTGWYKLFIGAAMPAGKILNVLTLLTAYTLILFAISCWAFEKREY
ncbi:ABC transporter permease [Clostridium sp. BL-8]|uniref:ABC transporter permease n=1 Tax=Clostridium sp. BL-8 TaxID=349938 RepID=UPI00098C2BC4|nr:ABC transporter permease [Clostridium sp. BL-8]OOM75234.1 ABC-2 family transporter protein [Clostridium sp. BL-8]